MHVAEIELYEILKEKKDVLATKEDVNNLKLEIEKTRSDIIKWMFIFWAGQFASLIAVLQIFFKK